MAMALAAAWPAPAAAQPPSAAWATRQAQLSQIGAALRARITAHNARCSQVPSDDTPLVQSCTQEQSELNAAIAAYEREVASLTNDAPKIGVSAAVRGDVYAELVPGERTRLAPGDPVRYGARLTTGADGRVQLLLADATTFTIGPDSDMVLDEFVYDPHTSVKGVAAQVAKGVFRYVTGKIAGRRPEHVKVVLPVDEIGVRGTDVEGYVADDQSGWVKLYSGEVVLTPKNGDPPLTLAAGQMVAFDAAGKLGAPGPLDPSIGPELDAHE